MHLSSGIYLQLTVKEAQHLTVKTTQNFEFWKCLANTINVHVQVAY